MKRYREEVLPLIVGAVMIALAARIEIPLPGTSVPQTAQTLAVLVAGLLFGSRAGALSAVTYLLLGVLGLPVFAGGSSGVGRLLGATGGFLVGFVVAAWIAGRWVELGRSRRFWPAMAGMSLAHGAVLSLGWARLAWSVGSARAWEVGVSPFLLGGLAKSVIGAALAVLLVRIRRAKGAG